MTWKLRFIIENTRWTKLTKNPIKLITIAVESKILAFLGIILEEDPSILILLILKTILILMRLKPQFIHCLEINFHRSKCQRVVALRDCVVMRDFFCNLLTFVISLIRF